MKYFTKDAWNGLQGKNSTRWHSMWMSNHRNYWRQARRLRSRLGSKLFQFFYTVSFHDGKLYSFKVSVNEKWPEIDFICVEICVRPWGRRVRRSKRKSRLIKVPPPKPYLLRYENVRKIEFNHPSGEPLFYKAGGDMGDWGYDEITSVDQKYLRHEILFSSGATILLEFEKMQVVKPR